jgi:hypothetical protein
LPEASVVVSTPMTVPGDALLFTVMLLILIVMQFSKNNGVRQKGYIGAVVARSIVNLLAIMRI